MKRWIWTVFAFPLFTALVLAAAAKGAEAEVLRNNADFAPDDSSPRLHFNAPNSFRGY